MTTDQITFSLYKTKTCPYCMKTISVINALNIDIELKDINDNSAYREELMQGGGKRQVPCLRTITSNGESSWLYESADIIKFFQKISA